VRHLLQLTTFESDGEISLSDVSEGWIELFHRTTPEVAEAIGRTRRFDSKEHDGSVYFSDRAQGEYAEGYGPGCVRVVMPVSLVRLDDEFQDGERHFRVRANQIRADWISAWYPTPTTLAGVYLHDLIEAIDGDRRVRERVMELAVRAHNATWLSEEERAVELGKEIAELFTKAVPVIISSDTPLAPVSRLVHHYFDHIDTDELGRVYLRRAVELEADQ